MKIATVREVQHGLSGILQRVERGEVVVVTRRGREVARIVPAAKKQRPSAWPDFAKRLRLRFPGGPPIGAPPSRLIDEDRKERA